MSKPNDDEPRKENPYQAEPTKSSSGRCCLYGCLLTFLLVAFVVVGGVFLGYRWFTGQVKNFTADAPADLPIVELPEAELAEIQGRVDSFKETIEAGDTPEDLVLTADEINALITKNDDFRGRVYVTIEDGEVSGDVSIPTDFLWGGEGRFFNASATFDVSLENGVLIVTLNAAEVKGERLPQQFIDSMSQQNLAKDVYKDPEVAAALRRIESISIQHDKIVMKPRVAAQQPNTGDASSENDPPSADPLTVPEEASESTQPSEPAGAAEASNP